MKRRNLLRFFLLSIFTFTFGWIIKKVSENTILQRGDSGEVTESGTNEIKLLTEKLADNAKKLNGWIDVTQAPYNAKGDGVTDDWQAIQDAINAGDKIFFPHKRFRLSNSLSFNSTKILEGSGCGLDYSTSKTVLEFDEGVAGIIPMTNNAAFTEISNICLYSKSVDSGTDDGIKIESNRVNLRNVLIEGFGRHGVNLDSTGVNSNLCQLSNVRAYRNKANGFNLSGGVDNNVITLDKCDASVNGGWGFYNTARHTLHLNCHASQNTLGAIYDNGNSNVYFMPYIEKGEGDTAIIDSASSTGTWIAGQYAAVYPTVHAKAQTSWTILFGSSFTRRLRIDNTEGPTTGKTYEFDSGVYKKDYFRLRNATDSKNIFEINSTTSRFNFFIPVAFTPVTASTVNNSVFVDGADNILKFRDNAGRTGNISRFVSVPASATATGTPGDWSADGNYMYVCYSVNKWNRVAVDAW
ncbi:hypothetical protein BAOM_4747 [Peribacillus asahii]|uniref:Rhamnogalacturonase A/B/Epimerase-like pectate lyase domain-containing protein n=1 Tax=Peribacillus asahii TaxID=228899 RepID=A0A3T0KYB5_9BACI|nr:glycosyl hydrolase family 28-related protein [Peribacillus asahii]AZV45325.1 hypothetical protein BAOM_4747 [Peribacillus asahii]